MNNVTLSLFAGAGAQFFDNSGNILTGGLIYTYAAGTTTPLATFTDNIGNTLHSNPIVLDASGRVNEIWLATGFGYKFVLKDSNNVLISTYDNIPSSAQPPITNDASSIAYEQGYTVTAGSFVIGSSYLITSLGSTNFQSIGATSNTVGIHFIATGVGSGTGTAELSRTVQAKLQESVSVLDFGADPTGVTDSSTAIQAAIAAADRIYFPGGIYKCNLTLQAVNGKHLIGASVGNANTNPTSGVKLIPNNSANPVISVIGWAIDVWLENFYIDSNLAGVPYSHTGVGILFQSVSPQALWRSGMRNIFIRGFQDGFVMDCDINIAEIFACQFFNIETVGCSRYSIKTKGVYNDFYKVFATQCDNYAIFNEASISVFDTVIGDARMAFRGASQAVRSLSIETIFGAGLGTGAALEINGKESTFDGIVLTGINTSEYPIGITLDGYSQTVKNVVFQGGQSNEPIRLNGGSSGVLEQVACATAVIPIGASPTIPAYADLWRFIRVPATLWPYPLRLTDDEWSPVSADLVAKNRLLIGSSSVLDGKDCAIGSTLGATGEDITAEQYVGTSIPVAVFSGDNYGWSLARTRSSGALTGRMSIYEYINNASAEQKIERIAMDSGGNFRPAADNTQSLGSAAYRWSVVYAGNGTINTSDANEKQQIQALTDAELNVAKKLKSLIRTFKFNDAVANKNSDARIHTGVIAQDVKNAFESENLSADKYGIFCSDTWYTFNGDVVAVDENEKFVEKWYEVDGKKINLNNQSSYAKEAVEKTILHNTVKHTRFGIRYDQLFAFIIAAL